MIRQCYKQETIIFYKVKNTGMPRLALYTYTFSQTNKNWKKIADHKIYLLNYISTEEIMEINVGNIYLQWIYFLLQICGYCGGVAFLFYILYMSCKKKAKCPSLSLNSFKTANVETKR